MWFLWALTYGVHGYLVLILRGGVECDVFSIQGARLVRVGSVFVDFNWKIDKYKNTILSILKHYYNDMPGLK